MSNYKPDLSNSIPLFLLIPTKSTEIGVTKKVYPKLEDILVQDSPNLFFGTFKSYGGTEKIINGIYSIIDTANIETWYRPDIKSDCKIALEDGSIYEIINEPENINRRNQFLKFKIKRIKGDV